MNNIELTGAFIFKNEFYSNEYIKQKVKTYQNIILENIGVCFNKKHIIGIYLDRSPEMMFAVLALFEMRIPLLLLDVKSPMNRVKLMIEKANVLHIITSKKNISLFSDKQLIIIDEYESQAVLNTKEMMDNEDEDEDIAYILFTSGSTGEPKGVMVKYTGLFNFIYSVPKIVFMSFKTIIGCFTNCSFDIFFLESLTALYSGSTVILGDDNTIDNPVRLIELIKNSNINMLQFTPSRLRMIQMIDNKFDCLRNVKTLLIGGEAFPEDLLHSLQVNTSARIYNMYGPTETTIWSSISDLTYENMIDIGKPIDNTQIYIVDERSTFTPNTDLLISRQEEVGEICIAGDGLAKGYLHNQEQTEKAFVKVLIHGVLTKLYRTGDLGYYNADGKVVCIGRIDDQIKLYGHRIELSEIEINLLKNPEISNSAVCFDNELHRLIAFVVLNSEHNNNKMYKEFEKSFSNHLSDNLPNYMLPSEYYFVDKLLYTLSGKLDRNALLDNYVYNIDENQIELKDSMYDEIMINLTKIISKIIGISNYELNKQLELKALNLNSIQFINIVVTCEDIFDIEFEDEQLMLNNFNTIGDIYNYIVSLLNK